MRQWQYQRPTAEQVLPVVPPTQQVSRSQELPVKLLCSASAVKFRIRDLQKSLRIHIGSREEVETPGGSLRETATSIGVATRSALNPTQSACSVYGLRGRWLCLRMHLSLGRTNAAGLMASLHTCRSALRCGDLCCPAAPKQDGPVLVSPAGLHLQAARVANS